MGSCFIRFVGYFYNIKLYNFHLSIILNISNLKNISDCLKRCLGASKKNERKYFLVGFFIFDLKLKLTDEALNMSCTLSHFSYVLWSKSVDVTNAFFIYNA